MNTVLTIAGSDSSGGAGIQADLKTFEAFKCFGFSAITVLTAQNTNGVNDIFEISPNFLKNQLKAIEEDFKIDAIKVGMLYNSEIIEIVYEFLKSQNSKIVLDPVSISRAGSKLLKDDALKSLTKLFKIADIITPNLYESIHFLDLEIDDVSNFEKILKKCEIFYNKYRTAIYIKNIKLKKDIATDLLFDRDNYSLFETPLLNSFNTHGTGCTLSSAISANLAKGKSLTEAIDISKQFILEAIKNAPDLGAGNGPINHRKASEAIGEKYA